MKKLLFIFCLFIFTAQSLFGVGGSNKLALNLQQAKKVDLAINRVNTLFEFVNLYILETANIDDLDGAFNVNMNHLTTRFGNLQTESFLKNQQIQFTVNSSTFTAHNGETLFSAKTVTLSNIVPNNLPSLVQQLYTNSINLHPQAVVNVDLSMTFTLNPETIQFINNTNMMKQLNTYDVNRTVIGIPSVLPTCTSVSQEGNVWYQPDGKGDYYLSVCKNHTPGGYYFEFLSNKLDTVLVQTNQSALTNMKPITGTVGYWLNGSQMEKMIFVEDNGSIGINGWVDVP
jgi:hypothetical protein